MLPASSLLGFSAKPTGADAQSRGLQFKAIGEHQRNAQSVAEQQSWLDITMKIHKNDRVGSTQNDLSFVGRKSNFEAMLFAEISERESIPKITFV